MGWWKRRKKRLKAKKYAEFLEAMGWERPTIEWAVPDVLHFGLSAYDESGKKIGYWYLGTRGYNEPAAMFMLVAYGLTETSERVVTPEEAVQIWSKWLSFPIYSDPIPLLSLEKQMFLFKTWIDWAKNDAENWDVAKEQIAALSSSCAFRVGVN